jgi:hypothetical protein
MQPLHESLDDAFAVLTGSKHVFTNYKGWEKELSKKNHVQKMTAIFCAWFSAVAGI